jgi:hypothetical protein
MTTHLDQLRFAFPRRLHDSVRSALHRLPTSSSAPTPNTIGPVCLDGEDIRIPARIYNPPQHAGHLDERVDTEAAIIHCLYSRHHDGFVRQRHLERLLPLTATWQAPFAFQIVGEYVVELIELLESSLDDDTRRMVSAFVEANPEFLARTQQRVLSYWNCYYRARWPRLEDYPGTRILDRLGIHATKRRGHPAG